MRRKRILALAALPLLAAATLFFGAPQGQAIGISTNVTGNDIGDSYFNANTTDTTNYGTTTYMQTSRLTWRALAKFDTSVVPLGATVTQVVMTIVYDNPQPACAKSTATPPPCDIGVYPISNTGWTETGVTGANQPAFGSKIADSTPPLAQNTTLTATLPNSSVVPGTPETDFGFIFNCGGTAGCTSLGVLASRECGSGIACFPPMSTLCSPTVTTNCGPYLAITYTTGTQDTLAFTTQPGGGAAGAVWAQQPVVTASNGAGTDTAFVGPVTLAIASQPGSGATLSCTANPVNASSGVASFSGCQITGTGGNYTLSASSPGTTSATSLGFPITGAGNDTCGNRTGTAATSKLLVVVEENHSTGVLTGGSMPYLNGLATKCAYSTVYQALTHPSLPNYLELTSGVAYNSSPWNSDCTASTSGCNTANDNIFNQVGSSGWKSYQEFMPSACNKSVNGPAPNQLYAVKHNPAAYYTDLGAACTSNDVELDNRVSSTKGLLRDAAAGTLPKYGFVTPNLISDMHDGTIGQADTWLSNVLPAIIAGTDYQSGALTIEVVWDEGSGSGDVTSNINAVFISEYITPGTVDTATNFTHYSSLKAAQEIAGVGTISGQLTGPALRVVDGGPFNF